MILGSPGKKNIRSGPGTNYRQRHIAYPGDRVQIIGSSTDQGGYRWYNIYCPKSKAEGWIASQLLLLDGQSAPPQPPPTRRVVQMQRSSGVLAVRIFGLGRELITERDILLILVCA